MTEQENPTLDCTDIRAMLSALVDDLASEADRHQAERHLVNCTACRELLSEAERNDVLVAALTDVDEPAGLPEGFEAAVLARADGPASRRWTSWLGWLTAAAALAVAAFVWWFDSGPDRAANHVPTVYPPGLEVRSRALDEPASAGMTTSGPWFRPVVNEIAAYVSDMPPQQGTLAATPISTVTSRSWSDAESTLSREAAEALEGTSLILSMLRQGGGGGFGDVEQARRIIEYDDLLAKLSAARPDMPAAFLPAVLAAESVMYRIARGPLSQDEVREMRQTIASLDLPQRLDSIRANWPDASTL
jgi:hypothetical protein